ncbi:hypothetical protein [Marinilactibacillus piezotolerans]|uniref:hypothetical protein n=1 Tax=Marinilactibacillus piezotolerans TaxID=258723 RepID=UPI0009AFAD79|nr:hypothetical protein [Marinilactibacillus piezotolerans]
MNFFTEETSDIEGYRKNLKSLQGKLDKQTSAFMLQDSFHDGMPLEIKICNPFEQTEYEEIADSIVDINMKIRHWNETAYELYWTNVMRYTMDFDISRNSIVGTDEVLHYRRLDEWGYDELTLSTNGKLHHEIQLFSGTTIIIECSQFHIKKL